MASLNLWGCGGGSSDDDTYLRPHNEIPTQSLPESQSAALRTYVYCAAENCNPSVGMLIQTTENKLGSCTASLIGDGLVVTNSHCVPDDLKTMDGADCSNRLYLFFPKVGNAPAVRADCATVLRASDIGKKGLHPDYAFIRLKSPVARPAIEFSGEGFHSEKSYRLPKVDPSAQNGAFIGRLVNTECTATYPTAVTPASDTPDSPVTSFSSCEIEHGNSGSPILDEQGQIRGVIQAKFEQNSASVLGMAFNGVFLDGVPRNIGIGTNLGCVDFPEVLPPRTIPAGCAVSLSENENAAKKLAASTAIFERMTREALNLASGTIAAPLEDVFEWQLASRKTGIFNQSHVLLVPKCFKPATGWIKHYKNFFGSTKKSASMNIAVPYWNAKIGLDRNLQLDGRLDPSTLGFYSTKIEFHPKEFANNGTSKVELSDAEAGLFSSGAYMSETLRSCL